MVALDKDAESESLVSWGLLDVAFGLVLSFLLAGGLVTLAAQLTPKTGEQNLVMTLAGLAGLWIGSASAVVLASYYRGQRSLNRDFGLSVRWSDVPIGLAIGVLGQVVLVNAIFALLRVMFPGVFDNVSDSARTMTDYQGWQFAVIALAVVVGAPFFEELFFRGLTQRAVARRFGQTVAVIVSGVFFGLVHYSNGTAVTLPALIPFGLLLAYIAARTGRLGMNVFTHVGFNLTTIVVLMVQRSAA